MVSQWRGTAGKLNGDDEVKRKSFCFGVKFCFNNASNWNLLLFYVTL